MASGIEIYTDNGVLQLGKEYYAAFLGESRTVAQVNANNVGEWKGIYRVLQTSGASIERNKVINLTEAFPVISNYTADSKWFKVLWRVNTGELTPSNFGVEIYDTSGRIEYNSNYNPLKIIDIVKGSYSKPSGGAGVNSGLYEVFKKQYDRPIMILIDRYYIVKSRLRVIANTSGKFELYLDFNNTDSFGSTSFNYQFIVLDATSTL